MSDDDFGSAEEDFASCGESDWESATELPHDSQSRLHKAANARSSKTHRRDASRNLDDLFASLTTDRVAAVAALNANTPGGASANSSGSVKTPAVTRKPVTYNEKRGSLGISLPGKQGAANESSASSSTKGFVDARDTPLSEDKELAHVRRLHFEDDSSRRTNASPKSPGIASNASSEGMLTIRNIQTNQTVDIPFSGEDEDLDYKTIKYEIDKNIPSGLNPLFLEEERRQSAAPVNDGFDRPRSSSGGRPKGKIGWVMRKMGIRSGEKKFATSENPHVTKVTSHKKPMKEYTNVNLVQSIEYHRGPIWCMKFSLDGRFLATAGHDLVVRLWVVLGGEELETAASGSNSNYHKTYGRQEQQAKQVGLFDRKPYRELEGHLADILDIAWSKNSFILTSSMDRTVRLWHPSKDKCLCYFQQPDIVTCVDFHPVHDKFFVSGSFDRTVRVWDIPKQRVVRYLKTSVQLTAITFSPNGKYVVCGSFEGKCKLYRVELEGGADVVLKYHTTLEVRSTRGANRKGKKISGIHFAPDGEQFLVTSNDSRIRLYRLDDLTLTCKYKGHENFQSQIKATLSDDGGYIICGSEDECVYVWNTQLKSDPDKKGVFAGSRRDRNEAYECFPATPQAANVAIYAPNNIRRNASLSGARGHLLVVAGYYGEIKVFENIGDPIFPKSH